LVTSRSEAKVAVDAGLVTIAGSPATKTTTMVADDAALVLAAPARRFVSRGGDKLRAALDRFAIDVDGAECLDAGASTGGFTDCLLQAGAARVTSVDVGYGQLSWQLRTDPRVVVLERTNVRDLRPDMVPASPSIVVADLSFISLRLVIDVLASVGAQEVTYVVLVKPQFEVGQSEVGKGGVVSEPATWERVIREVSGAFAALGLPPTDVMASPLLGPAGNVEFLMRGRRAAAAEPLDLGTAIDEGKELRR
jgi:23S rRNA (cytidine1920-2'-O)/16S rRNA (cytidine1409-2'-O)-methyltransferase